MKKLAIAILFAFAACATLNAATSAFAYQGILLNEQGTAPLTGNKTIELRLYNVADGGSALWGRAYSVLLADNGLFNLEVSDNTGSALSGTPSTTLEKVFAGNKDAILYIGLKVANTAGEIAPRQKLLAVPYATFANDAAGSSGDFTVAGTVTAASSSISGDISANAVNVSGATGSATLSVTGDATIGGALKVGGAVTGGGIVPLEGIIMWSGSSIPANWALCNGQTVNGHRTPDLRDRFIVGSGNSYSVGATGGEAFHTLTIAEMPSHNHSYSYKGADLVGSWKNKNNFYCTWNKYDNNNNSSSTSYSGGNQAHENRPPYYALAFIMRVK